MINLNDKQIMSAQEAAEKWGLKDASSIRHSVSRFPEGTIRKFGKQWVVTEGGMQAVFGNKKQS